ncbi:Aminoglycoside phosphotransferase domain-containing protein [Frankia sp. AiPs1]
MAAMARLAAQFTPLPPLAAAGPPGPAEPPGRQRRSGPVVVSRRDDRLVVRCGAIVLKAHAAGTDPDHLGARLRLAARPALREVLLPALAARDAPQTFMLRIGSRLVSAWPAGHALDERDADTAPWAPAGSLLARLHRAPSASGELVGLPSATVLRRLADRIARLRPYAGHPLVVPVLAAHAVLPAIPHPVAPGQPRATLPRQPTATLPGRPTALIHGDWHFGQLVDLPGAGWRIIDVDDLGFGDPAWDLARPAAWFACGLLPVDRWARFLDAYRAGGGPAVPAEGDPWPALDLPARALTIEYAATAVAAHLGVAAPSPAQSPTGTGFSTGSMSPLDDVGREFVAACARIASAYRSVPG